MIKVTEMQNDYLLLLEEGPKTTNDLMRDRMVTMESASRMIRKLKKVGLVKSEKKPGCRGNPQDHSLTMPYKEMVEKGLIIKAHTEGLSITEQEVRYAAILRNEGLTGQRLSEQYRKAFPKRTKGAIKNIVQKARKQGLCR